ncbi:MAG: endolytic transglycosylase MltG [Bacillota bacterium]|jgi:UPF0755 protein|nr:endolytic transglycosylase MltG [Clostridia bacterium]
MAKRRRKKIFTFATLFMLLLAVTGGLYLRYLISPVKVSGTIALEIPQKATTTRIALLLAEKGLIRDPLIFKVYAKAHGLDRHLKAGEYQFSGDVSLKDIEEVIVKGRAVTESFTIPEGFTEEQIAQHLAAKGLVDKEKFLAYAREGSFEYKYLPPEGTDKRLEGFLFPDTYYITKGFSERQIIEMMLARFDQIFKEEWRKRADELGMTIGEVVTLASLVEREARVSKDRPLVASVFHNRLKIGMHLESCATVQYALGEVKEVLLFEDLETESPYNTYLHGGLPPGPIAAPGADSLQAALYPEKTNYLYFVAKKDGSHYFSKTLAEHNKAKRLYLK